jgi:hypothetical protein
LLCEVFGGEDERVDVDVLVCFALDGAVIGGGSRRCRVGGSVLAPIGEG